MRKKKLPYIIRYIRYSLEIKIEIWVWE